jgi:ABC-type branched-subunit amino acid transport system ATPase component
MNLAPELLAAHLGVLSSASLAHLKRRKRWTNIFQMITVLDAMKVLQTVRFAQMASNANSVMRISFSQMENAYKTNNSATKSSHTNSKITASFARNAQTLSAPSILRRLVRRSIKFTIT